MASPFVLLISTLLFFQLAHGSIQMNLTTVNNCPFTIYPVLHPGFDFHDGFGEMSTLAYRTYPMPSNGWSGSIWARTGCDAAKSGGGLYCATGDCGTHGFICGDNGPEPPVSVVQLAIRGEPGLVQYSVSLVDGFNLPVTVTPHGGTGNCPVVGCSADLLATCPASLAKRNDNIAVIGCRSGCGAMGYDELCCRGQYSRPPACRPSQYSRFFKEACPATVTYPSDTSSLLPYCSSPGEIKIIFCP